MGDGKQRAEALFWLPNFFFSSAEGSTGRGGTPRSCRSTRLRRLDANDGSSRVEGEGAKKTFHAAMGS